MVYFHTKGIIWSVLVIDYHITYSRISADADAAAGTGLIYYRHRNDQFLLRAYTKCMKIKVYIINHSMKTINID